MHTHTHTHTHTHLPGDLHNRSAFELKNQGRLALRSLCLCLLADTCPPVCARFRTQGVEQMRGKLIHCLESCEKRLRIIVFQGFARVVRGSGFEV